MKFVNIDIKNFMAIGEASLSLSDRGLLLVQGENKDDTSQNSNGAGKSSIVDALCWCLYGQTAREESGDSVVNTKAGKNCRVVINIDDGEDTYTVTRHRKYTKKRNVLELVKNDKDDLTQGTDKLTQEKVNQILGCSYDVFRASVYAGQDAQIDLPIMTDKFLKQVVEEAAGIDRLQAAHELAKEKRNLAKSSVEEVEKSIFASEMQIEESQLHLSDNEERVKQYEEDRQQNIDKLEFRIKNAKTKASKLVKEIRAIDHESNESEYEALINKAVDDEWKEKREELRFNVSHIQSSLAKANAELTVQRKDLQALKKVITDSESLIGQPCGECGKLYEKEDIADAVANAREKINKTLPDAKRMRKNIEELEESLSGANAELETHEQSATLSDEEKTRRDELKAKLSEYQTLMQQARDAKRDIKADIEKMEEVKGAENPHTGAAESIKARIDTERENIQSCNDDMEDAKKKLAIAEGVVQVYSNTGVRAHILDTVTPFLNERTALYLGQLSDGNIEAIWNTLSTTAKGELREKFNIDVTSKTGGKSYKGLSGGEKRKVRLATNMALQDLVASRASKPLDLYIGDEIDHALDVSGLERLMALLEEKAKSQGTVLVISHNELSDWIRESITVVKDGGYTTIQE